MIETERKNYLKKGNKIQYNSSEGFFISYATILDIHDDKKPYYTIKILDDNREIQTEGNRLSEIPNLSPNKLNIIKNMDYLKLKIKKFNLF